MNILVLNSGSSSQKSCLYKVAAALPAKPATPAWEAEVDWETDRARVKVKHDGTVVLQDRIQVSSRREAIEKLLDTLWSGDLPVVAAPSAIDVVGHRIVHGAGEYQQPVLIDGDVKRAIDRLGSLAPLHNGAESEGIDIIEKRLGQVKQVAVFDTAFHRTLPDAAAVYPGPYEWLGQGIRRYGFHGINHEYCATRAAEMLGRDLADLRLVSCHLGSGCSLAAITGGLSVDTTMGFTPAEGLMMGTRAGSVDSGILTYLMRQRGLTADQLDDLLNRKSGLLGTSGISANMRRIVDEKEKGNARARLAFDIFVHRLRSGIGSMIASLGGIDALLFTAGIGENSREVRTAACAGFEYLGLQIDEDGNAIQAGDRDIARPDSGVRILVIAAQEDWAIARECWSLINGGKSM